MDTSDSPFLLPKDRKFINSSWLIIYPCVFMRRKWGILWDFNMYLDENIERVHQVKIRSSSFMTAIPVLHSTCPSGSKYAML